MACSGAGSICSELSWCSGCSTCAKTTFVFCFTLRYFQSNIIGGKQLKKHVEQDNIFFISGVPIEARIVATECRKTWQTHTGEKTILAYFVWMSKMYNRATEAEEVWPRGTTLICLSKSVLKIRWYCASLLWIPVPLRNRKKMKPYKLKGGICATCRTHDEQECKESSSPACFVQFSFASRELIWFSHTRRKKQMGITSEELDLRSNFILVI